MKLKLCLCVCTYRRPHLLEKLLRDVFKQTLVPDVFVIVDGDPQSGEVKKRLASLFDNRSGRPVFYVPSNRANLSFQRYLAWRTASSQQCSHLLYLDDDIRLNEEHLLNDLADLLVKHPEAAGITSTIRYGQSSRIEAHKILDEQRRGAEHKSKFQPLCSRFGYRRHPGSLTPIGHRIPPLDDGSGVSRVEWLRGAVMFYSLKAMSEEVFSEDLFAVNEIRCGLGEDTLLSRRISLSGTLLLSHRVIVDHPDEDMPNAYPVEPFRLGFAAAYSRRLLNDHYRIDQPPHLSDRLFLYSSYGWNILRNLLKAAAAPSRQRFSYFFGYGLGALKGLLGKPLASRLTPGVMWRQEADHVLKNICLIGDPG